MSILGTCYTLLSFMASLGTPKAVRRLQEEGPIGLLKVKEVLSRRISDLLQAPCGVAISLLSRPIRSNVATVAVLRLRTLFASIGASNKARTLGLSETV